MSVDNDEIIYTDEGPVRKSKLDKEWADTPTQTKIALIIGCNEDFDQDDPDGAAYLIWKDIKKDFETLARQVEALEAEMEWRPIETAPKDGTEIIAWRHDAGFMMVRWDAPENFLPDDEIDELGDSAKQYDWFCADFVAPSRLEGVEIPTHWKPLPEPPK